MKKTMYRRKPYRGKRAMTEARVYGVILFALCVMLLAFVCIGIEVLTTGI